MISKALSLTIVFTFPSAVFAAPLMFDTVEEAAAFAKSELAGGKRKANAAIVFKYSFSDGTQKPAKGRFYLRGGYSGLKLKPNVPGLRFVTVNSKDFRIRLSKKGHHDVDRVIKVREGEVVIVDDLVLEPVTKESASEVSGHIWLEGDGDLMGTRIKLGDSYALTDANGAFRFSNVRSGEMLLHAIFPDGYRMLRRSIKVKPCSHEELTVKGYFTRTALVRWAYQPEASRNLAEGLEKGESILGTRMLERIKCSEGFVNGSRSGDFNVEQGGDQLKISCPQRRKHGAGFLHLADLGFDEVLAAPRGGYEQEWTAIAEGDVFVFRTLDGKHHGKLEVLHVKVGNAEKAKQPSDSASDLNDP